MVHEVTFVGGTALLFPTEELEEVGEDEQAPAQDDGGNFG